jgi:MFS family permease
MVTAYLHALRLTSRDTRLFLITWALTGLTFFGGIYNVLFNLYLLRLGYGPRFVGLVNATGLMTLAIFSLPAGAIGGRWGGRRTMIAGLILTVAGLGLPPFAEFIPTLQAGWLIVTYSLALLGFTLYSVNSLPFLTGATGPEERSHVFSVRAAIFPLGGFVGSLVGGLMPGFFARALGFSPDHPASYRYSLMIAALLLMPAVLLMLATREVSIERRQETLSEEGYAPFGLIFLMALIMLLRVAGEGVARTFFNVYLDAGLGLPAAQIGTLAAAGQLLAVPAPLAMPLLAACWSKDRTIVLGSLGMVLSLLPIAFISHWAAAGGGFMVMIALGQITVSAFFVYTQEIVAPAWRGAMSGATVMAVGLSWSAIALGGGYIITTLGYRNLFLIGAGLTAAGALLFWAYFLRRPRGEFARRVSLDRAK